MVTRIREAVTSDARAIEGFNRAMAWETERLELDAARLKSGVEAVLTDRNKGFYLVAEADGVVIGQAMVTREWSDWRNGTFWWIQSVYVAPEHRGRGVFGALYRLIREMGEADGGVCGIRLYVEHDNERAQRVYEKLGMAATHYRLLEVDFVLRRR